MHARLRFLAILVSTALLCIAADLPTGDSLMQQAMQRSGTPEALAKVTSIVMTGRIVVEGRNIEGPVSVYQQGNKNYTVIEFPGLGKVEEGYDGTVAWETNALQGTRLKEGEEKAAAVRSSRMNLLASWRTEYKSARTLGEGDVDGKPAWKVELTPHEGKPETFFFDKESGLPVRIAQTAVSPLGEIQVDLTLSDYRPVDGVQTPFVMTERAIGQVMTMRFAKIIYGSQIPPDRFELPAAVKALVAAKNK
ncbi:MAG TPA: hypothetical protein VNH18_21750 [Bryobacteraceae bacterium]|nr:hypothetical protein [Bryobacteraceae bacterium]